MFSATEKSALDYAACRYNESRLWFRGPRRSLSGRYIACLGGSETYGKFVEHPFPDILEKRLKVPVANLGVAHAGPDAFLQDPGALQTAFSAEKVVVQICNTSNVSNRFYSVHPRRNDRFLKASDALRALYPEMDFTEIHFVRHLLQSLHGVDAVRFDAVRNEIQIAWRSRMMTLLGHLRSKALLLWLSAKELPQSSDDVGRKPYDLMNREVIAPCLARARDLVFVVPGDWNAGRDQMHFSDFDASQADVLPTPDTHQLAAQKLETVLH